MRPSIYRMKTRAGDERDVDGNARRLAASNCEPGQLFLPNWTEVWRDSAYVHHVVPTWLISAYLDLHVSHLFPLDRSKLWQLCQLNWIVESWLRFRGKLISVLRSAAVCKIGHLGIVWSGELAFEIKFFCSESGKGKRSRIYLFSSDLWFQIWV